MHLSAQRMLRPVSLVAKLSVVLIALVAGVVPPPSQALGGDRPPIYGPPHRYPFGFYGAVARYPFGYYGPVARYPAGRRYYRYWPRPYWTGDTRFVSEPNWDAELPDDVDLSRHGSIEAPYEW